MLDKFNFYDFLGYLLPGAAVTLTIYWVGKVAFLIPFPDLAGDLTTSFAFVGISYVVGHLVQGFGSLYERSLQKSGSGLEEWLLIPGHPRIEVKRQLPPHVVRRIRAIAKAVFGATDETEIFNVCYALIVQKNLAQHTEIFLAMKGLARGMLVATFLGLVVAGLVAAEQLLLRHFENSLLAGAAMVALVPVAVMFQREFNRFGIYFTQSVYWNFLAWYADKTMDAKPAAKSGWFKTLLGM